MKRNIIQMYEEAIIRMAPKNPSFRTAAAKIGFPYINASMEEYKNMIKSVYDKVESEFKPEIVIGILQGGFYPAYVLSHMFGCELDYAESSANFLRDIIVLRHFTYRRNCKTGSITPKLIRAPTEELNGKRVLIVDEEATSGNTVKLIKRIVERQNPLEIRTASLVNYKNQTTDYYAKLVPITPKHNPAVYINLPNKRYSPFFNQYAKELYEIQAKNPELKGMG
jgi:hypoxanthine phosphoribosyltransferase